MDNHLQINKLFVSVLKTRMHSSRMHTDCSSSHLGVGGASVGCIHATVGVHLRGASMLQQGGCIQRGVHPGGASWMHSSPCKQNDTCLWKHYLPRFATLCSGNDNRLKKCSCVCHCISIPIPQCYLRWFVSVSVKNLYQLGMVQKGFSAPIKNIYILRE